MKRWLARLALSIGLLLSYGGAIGSDALAAETISTKDVQAIRETVALHLEALAKDDAVTAFHFATSAKRLLIGSADNFLEIIKQQFDPIYRHQSVIFSPAEVIEGATIQIVRVTDRESHVWLAVFRMQQEQDGTWKIDGCKLMPTTGVSV